MRPGNSKTSEYAFDWRAFFERTKDQPPRPLVVKAVRFASGTVHAIDLGSGALNDTRFLLEHGFTRVTAVDEIPMAGELAATLPSNRFEYIISSFEDFEFPRRAFDLVNAQNSLSFTAPDQFDRVFEAILSSLKPGGVFAAQLVGDRDQRASERRDMSFRSAKQILAKLAGLNVVDFAEEKTDRASPAGLRHKHSIKFVAVKDSASHDLA